MYFQKAVYQDSIETLKVEDKVSSRTDKTIAKDRGKLEN